MRARRRSHGTTLWISGVQAGAKGDETVGNCRGSVGQRKSRPKAAFRGAQRGDQAVSPSTVTVMSTTTSVCRATETLLSPTALIGPLGMRTWALATL